MQGRQVRHRHGARVVAQCTLQPGGKWMGNHSWNERGQAGNERWVQGDHQTVRRARYHLSWEERTRANMDRNRKGNIKRASLQTPGKTDRADRARKQPGCKGGVLT